MKAVGEAKGSSASAQWAAAVIGAALSTATGGDAQSGASIAANAIKNNKFLEYVPIINKMIAGLPNAHFGDSGECVASMLSFGVTAGAGFSVSAVKTDINVYDGFSFAIGPDAEISPGGMFGEVRMFKLPKNFTGTESNTMISDDTVWVKDWNTFNKYLPGVSNAGTTQLLVLGGTVIIPKDCSYGYFVAGVGRIGLGVAYEYGITAEGTKISEYSN